MKSRIIKYFRQLLRTKKNVKPKMDMIRIDKWQRTARSALRKIPPERMCGNCQDFKGTKPFGRYKTELGLCNFNSHPAHNIVKITEYLDSAACFSPIKNRFLSFRGRFKSKPSARYRAAFTPRESQSAVW